MIARRIENVLPLLVSSDQSGFVKGRHIGQNIRLINNILEQTKLQDISGIHWQLDFQKAFDTIKWKFIQKSYFFFLTLVSPPNAGSQLSTLISKVQF